LEGVWGDFLCGRKPTTAAKRCSLDAAVICSMTEDEIAKLRDSLLQAMRVDPQLGVPVTIENFEAAAELAKLNQAECYHLNGRLYIRELRFRW
jgi:hypothetical protein